MNAGRSLTRSSHKRVGCLVSAAVRALPSATSGVVAPAPSNRSSRSGIPASSTIAIDTFHLFFSASALQAASILWASPDVRQCAYLLLVLEHFPEKRQACHVAGLPCSRLAM